MARPNRGKPNVPRSLTAAAKSIDLTAKRRDAQKRQAAQWQSDAWDYFDATPEVKELIQWRANQLGKLRFFVAAHPGGEADAEPVSVLDPESGVPSALAAAAVATFDRLRSPLGGQSEIVKRLDMNLEVPGEAYVVGFMEREVAVPGQDEPEVRPEEWMVASLDEVEVKGKGATQTYAVRADPNDKNPRVLFPGDPDDPEAPADVIFRVWQPHARWQNMADSAMRGVIGECETLQILTNQMKAEGRSRAHAGVMVVHSGLTWKTGSPDQPDGDGTESGFLDDLIETLVTPAADPTAGSAVVPAIAEVDLVEVPDPIKWVDLGRDTGDVLDKRVEGRVMRIARGLNAPVEVVTGLMETTFANAERIDLAKFEEYLQPRAVQLADAFTVGFLHPMLIREGLAPEQVEGLFVWFDPEDLLAKPDTTAGANDAWDRGLISDEAYRRHKGYDEGDASDDQERVTRLGERRGILTADLTAALISPLAAAAGIELPEVEPGGAAPEVGVAAALALLAARSGNGHHPPSPFPRAVLAASRPVSGQTAGRKLARIDAELRTRLVTAANAAMNRALERAGSKLRGQQPRSVQASLKRTPPELVAVTLDLTAASVDVEDLFGGAFDALEDQFKRWGASAAGDAVEVVNRLIGFSGAARDRLGLRLAEGVDEAWEWMREALASLASARLFDPTPLAAPAGEFDPDLRVPPGLVRQAVARAGGNTGLMTRGEGSAFVTLSQAGTRPSGGLATGEAVFGALADGGVTSQGYVWDYGVAPRKRPFEPHLRLDGTQFGDFDDPVLANTSGFPSFAHYFPGDHDGCWCDAVPILLTPEGAERVVPEFVPAES